MTTLIENAVIIPMTGRNRFMKGSILIRDGIIMEAGNIAEAEADETIDADGMIALPSFVNAHTHLAMVLMRNYKDTCENLQDWLSEIFPIEDKLDDDDIYQASRLGAAELIQSGCTVFADMYFRAWNTVKAVKEAGCRAIIGQTFMNDAADARFRINEIAPRILEEIGDDSWTPRTSPDVRTALPWRAPQTQMKIGNWNTRTSSIDSGLMWFRL